MDNDDRIFITHAALALTIAMGIVTVILATINGITTRVLFYLMSFLLFAMTTAYFARLEKHYHNHHE